MRHQITRFQNSSRYTRLSVTQSLEEAFTQLPGRQAAMARASASAPLLLLLLLALSGPLFVSANADFCDTISSALNTCPVVPTADVDLSAYTVSNRASSQHRSRKQQTVLE